MQFAMTAKTITTITVATEHYAGLADSNGSGLSIGGTTEERRALLLKWLEAELTDVEETHEEEAWFNALKAKFASWDWELARRDPGPCDLVGYPLTRLTADGLE